MGRKSFQALLVAALTLLSAASAFGAFDPVRDPALLGWWSFDEGSGTVAADGSGKGNNGTLTGGPAWVPGVYGTALRFNGQGSYVGTGKSLLNGVTGFTMAGWVSAGNVGVYSSLCGQNDLIELGFTTENGGQLGTWMLGNNWAFIGANWTFTYPSWHHVALAGDRTKITLYIDGQEKASDKGGMSSGSSSYFFSIGGNVFNASGDWFRGEIDDVWLFSRALTDAEIQLLMKGPGGPGRAIDPRPADKAVDVPRDVVLGWTPGAFAATHDVYLGQTFADVNDGSQAKPAGVLASQGQTATTYSPTALLDFGQTYYWRVDEVNKAPDNTVFKGTVWSLTVEPYSYPITAVTATASSAQTGMGPENTINGSGLAGDRHGIDSMTMWTSKGTLPNWIQYRFDAVYKLDKLLVWNSNQAVESYVGFGAKDVTIESSVDGTAWTALAAVPQFAQATGLPTYTANTTVTFGGVSAKYVRLTINKTWGGLTTTGLSEVRFYSIPVQARAPQPAAGATGVSVATSLNWRPGREATSHNVFFGTDPNAVANGTAAAKTVTGHTFDPGALVYGTKYYWKVDEIGGSGPYAGGVWSFTTQEFAAVDDFESYNDKDNCIFDTWIDGVADGKSGSQVGYLNAPFAETTIIHGGKQSMPMAYDNTKSPFYSDTTRDLGSAGQDWTGNGATHMDLWFRGYPAVTGVAITETGGKMTLTGSGTDIWNTSDEFTFAYKTLTGDGTMVARVASVGTGTNGWAKGGVMIRDSLDGGSAFVDMVLTGASTSGNGASFQYRPTANGGCGNTDALTAIVPPYWVKIQRVGDNITGWVSANGTSWAQIGVTQVIKMTAPAYIGICVTSHQAGEQRKFDFDNISSAGGVTGAWQGAQVNSPRLNDPAGLYVVVEDTSGKSKLVTHPDPAAAATGAWTQWKIPLSDLTAAGVKTTKVRKLTIGAGDRTSPRAGGIGMLFIDDIGFGHPLP